MKKITIKNKTFHKGDKIILAHSTYSKYVHIFTIKDILRKNKRIKAKKISEYYGIDKYLAKKEQYAISNEVRIVVYDKRNFYYVFMKTDLIENYITS